MTIFQPKSDEFPTHLTLVQLLHENSELFNQLHLYAEMTDNKIQNFIPIEKITNKIFLIRNQKILLDSDLANLYDIETKKLLQAVKRNILRFPDDFMFQLNEREFKNLRSQIVTSSWGGRRYLPYAFTEQGIAMLSSVLNTDRAIQVNIAMRI